MSSPVTTRLPSASVPFLDGALERDGKGGPSAADAKLLGKGDLYSQLDRVVSSKLPFSSPHKSVDDKLKQPREGEVKQLRSILHFSLLDRRGTTEQDRLVIRNQLVKAYEQGVSPERLPALKDYFRSAVASRTDASQGVALAALNHVGSLSADQIDGLLDGSATRPTKDALLESSLGANHASLLAGLDDGRKDKLLAQLGASSAGGAGLKAALDLGGPAIPAFAAVVKEAIDSGAVGTLDTLLALEDESPAATSKWQADVVALLTSANGQTVEGTDISGSRRILDVLNKIGASGEDGPAVAARVLDHLVNPQERVDVSMQPGKAGWENQPLKAAWSSDKALAFIDKLDIGHQATKGKDWEGSFESAARLTWLPPGTWDDAHERIRITHTENRFIKAADTAVTTRNRQHQVATLAGHLGADAKQLQALVDKFIDKGAAPLHGSKLAPSVAADKTYERIANLTVRLAARSQAGAGNAAAAGEGSSATRARISAGPQESAPALKGSLLERLFGALFSKGGLSEARLAEILSGTRQ